MATDSPVPATLGEREQAAIAALTRIRDPQSRFAWLVERARERPLLPDALRTDAHRVEGCLVRIWFVPEIQDGRCVFQTDSDAVTLRALAGLWCALASGATPAELSRWQPDFFERLGLMRQLAESRRATVLRIGDQIRAFAAANAARPDRETAAAT